jgi:hypothetical protein
MSLCVGVDDRIGNPAGSRFADGTSHGEWYAHEESYLIKLEAEDLNAEMCTCDCEKSTTCI